MDPTCCTPEQMALIGINAAEIAFAFGIGFGVITLCFWLGFGINVALTLIRKG